MLHLRETSTDKFTASWPVFKMMMELSDESLSYSGLSDVFVPRWLFLCDSSVVVFSPFYLLPLHLLEKVWLVPCIINEVVELRQG